jgi:exodeoxyribonuclease VII large subunit
VSRNVKYDGAGAFQIRFPFDRGLVDLIKTLPNRRWNAAERFWSVPEDDIVPLVEMLESRSFRFDSATREAYRALGGTITLGEAEAENPSVPKLPGLFDDAEAEPRLARSEDLTVSQLNERVRQVIEDAFPRPLWLIGEISGFNRNAHKKHVGFQLVEKDAGGTTVSEISATLFERTRRELERGLAAAGDPFGLEDEITVRVRVSVGLYVPWGSYRVVVEELDVKYTLGEAARRREEILRRLTEVGLIGVNSALPLPPLPLRVGLITSLGSDAYNDVLRTLQESRFAFRVLAHGARVQGHATEPSVLNALDVFRRRAQELDIVVICRGGGSRTDLAWFDSEALGRNVADFPLPVIVGIGHEQDRSVLDEVGRRCKTPTAAAQLLVATVQRSLDALETLGARALAGTNQRLQDERRRDADRGRRLGLAARALLGAATERVARLVRDIPRAGGLQLTRQQTFLDHVQRAVAQGARRDLGTARYRVEQLVGTLGPSSERRLRHETERSELRGRRLRLVDPRRVLERGYSILRTTDGILLTAAEMAPIGTEVVAELKRGGLRLRSEGPTADGGGD